MGEIFPLSFYSYKNMLKKELELENQDLKDKYNNLKNAIIIGIRDAIDNTCEESYAIIEKFCETIEIPMPKIKYTLEIELPYDQMLQNQDLYLENSFTLEDTIVDYKIIKTELC